jgi:hypothetical protein
VHRDIRFIEKVRVSFGVSSAFCGRLCVISRIPLDFISLSASGASILPTKRAGDIRLHAFTYTCLVDSTSDLKHGGAGRGSRGPDPQPRHWRSQDF